jgi:hypothetical protein
VSFRSRDSMRVRRDGWRRDGGRFMRSRVVVVVGVVLLEPSLFVDFAYDVPLDLVCRGVVQHSGYPGGVEDFVLGDVGAVDTRVEGVVEVVVWVATEGTEPVEEARGQVGLFGSALCLRRRAASAADDLRVARGCRWRNLVVVDSVPVGKRRCVMSWNVVLLYDDLT